MSQSAYLCPAGILSFPFRLIPTVSFLFIITSFDDKSFVRKVAHYASYCKIAKTIYSDKEIYFLKRNLPQC